MKTRKIIKWALLLALLLGVYSLVFLFGFDKNEPSFDEGFTKIEFQTSPKWVRFEMYNGGFTSLGRRATFWNHLFYPAERAWRFVQGSAEP